MSRYKISTSKQALIDNLINSDYVIGEVVSYPLPNHGTSIGYIRKIENGKATVESYYGHKHENNVCDVSQLSKYSYMVGANPFDGLIQMKSYNYQLSSIISQMFREEKYHTNAGTLIPNANFNPIVYDANGEVVYYQRGNVWTLENKQALIESIYNGVDCGKIIVRERDWDEIDALEAAGLEFAFYDVVDGKQRLTALNEFINDVFPDSYGNYYSDLSDHAQHAFGDNQLISYAEMKPHTKDADVIKTFLRMNFSGIPQSKEHLDYLKSIKM